MGKATVLDDLRRCRAIRTLYKQTAASRPLTRRSTWNRAEEPDQVALAQLESYFWRAERRQPAW
jgi:hypothetical protein